MRSMNAVITQTALALVGIIAIPTHGCADEQVRITGEPKEVKFEGGQLQIIPTERGVFLVVGELVMRPLVQRTVRPVSCLEPHQCFGKSLNEIAELAVEDQTILGMRQPQGQRLDTVKRMMQHVHKQRKGGAHFASHIA